MSHYYDKKQDSRLEEQTITVRVAGLELSFFTANGLFSKEHLDTATKLLLEYADLREAKTVLDLGCGWGVVACVLKRLFDDLDVHARDYSERAVEFTEKNAKRHKLSITCTQGNVCEGLELFDVILTNPPYSAGREVCYQFIEQSFAHLNTGGSLQLVARHQKGGKMLQEKMEEVFGNVEILAKGSGFRVYCSRKN